MFNINKFIGENITSRPNSLFASDIEANKGKLREEIEGKSLLVIGGAGSIGSSFIRAMLPFKPSKLVVVDLSENGLAELTRDLRSTYGMYVPDDYRTYTLNFADPIFERIFHDGMPARRVDRRNAHFLFAAERRFRPEVREADARRGHAGIDALLHVVQQRSIVAADGAIRRIRR